MCKVLIIDTSICDGAQRLRSWWWVLRKVLSHQLEPLGLTRTATQNPDQGKLQHVRVFNLVPAKIGLHVWVCVPLTQRV